MAIVTCDHCGKRMSSRHAHCPHCGRVAPPRPDRGPAAAQERLRRLRHRAQDLSNLSLLLMVAGSIWYYVESDGLQKPAGAGPVWVLAAGASVYLYLRIWLLLRRLRRRPPS